MYFFVETFEDCGSVGDLMIFVGLDLKGKYCHNTVTSCIFFCWLQLRTLVSKPIQKVCVLVLLLFSNTRLDFAKDIDLDMMHVFTADTTSQLFKIQNSAFGYILIHSQFLKIPQNSPKCLIYIFYSNNKE